MFARRGRRGRGGARGQGLVEFSIVLPVFLLMLFAIVDLGRVVWATNALANAAREGARFAIVNGGSEITRTPIGPGLSKQPVIDVARGFAIAAGENLGVDVCYGERCTASTDTTGGNGRGTPVTVTVRSEVRIFTGSLLGFPMFPVSGSSTMLVNN